VPGTRDEREMRLLRADPTRISLSSLARLPPLPSEASRLLLEEMRRGSEAARTAIHYESERTIDERASARDPDVDERSEISVGSRLAVARRMLTPQGEREVEERFDIEEQISSDHNISGDVFRARRFWDGQCYGDVVLKTPKAGHRRSLSRHEQETSEKELRNLTRFAGHPAILSASGRPFLYQSQVVIQTEYQPWSLSEYLKYFHDEELLTTALTCAAAQCFDAIAHMAELRDEEGPDGYVHVDLKTSHLRLDYKEYGASAGEWVVTIIDLDSIAPAGRISLGDAKYNLACVDPEKFMPLHDPQRLVTVDPAEAVYGAALSFLYAMAQRLGVNTRRRGFKIVGLEQVEERVRLHDEAALRRAIEHARAVDELNLLKVYTANKLRRTLSGHFDQDPELLRELIERHAARGDVRKEAFEEVVAAADSCSVRPELLATLRQCLLPREQRPDARSVERLFAR
jgi:hypothetical protein